jgi:hypothetical protein
MPSVSLVIERVYQQEKVVAESEDFQVFKVFIVIDKELRILGVSKRYVLYACPSRTRSLLLL